MRSSVTALEMALLLLSSYGLFIMMIYYSTRMLRGAFRPGFPMIAASGLMAMHPTIMVLNRFGLFRGLSDHLALLDIAGSLLMSIGFALWIRWVNQTLRRVDQLAQTDYLTGLFNRLGLERSYQNAINSQTNRFALMVMDLDGFKNVNDTQGHGFGDQVLQDIAHILTEELRESDIIARQGGDEFIAVLKQTDSDTAQVVVERLKKRVQELPVEGNLTLSIGMAVYPDDGQDIETLIRIADSRMYHDKRGFSAAGAVS